ncbi:hypothetical protein Y032_0059g3073 [Ancylostoma ceylanicum]|uniref:Uncharacterized protein n=1 Tax=Ancylostoma ceylanicum TaxID=53326 RepID=A0A016U4Q8_9BILA|nr:hypothetical protein Y032_0059g3073 [Ancylostoma ceylanicum]
MQEADIKFRILASGVLEVLNKYKRRQYCNMTREQWQGLRQLREMTDNGSIRVTVSDKGGEFVIIPQAPDREITDLHLRDATINRQTDEKEFMAQCRRLNDVWALMTKSAGIDERFVSVHTRRRSAALLLSSDRKVRKRSKSSRPARDNRRYPYRLLLGCLLISCSGVGSDQR